MDLQYIAEDNRLIVRIAWDDQLILQQLQTHENFHSDQLMYEVFETLISNSELEWIDASETGDLTDAPILGIRGDSGILARWAYMDYQIKSPLDDLANNGEVIFIS